MRTTLDWQLLLVQLKSRFNPAKALAWSNLGFLALAVWLAGGLVAHWLQGSFPLPEVQVRRFNPPTVKKEQASLPFSQFQDTLTYNLFNARLEAERANSAEPLAAPTPTGSLSRILADLKLVGVFAGAEAFCILRNKAGDEALLSKGEKVFDTEAEVFLVMLAEKKVVLKLGQERGELVFFEELDANAQQNPEGETSSGAAQPGAASSGGESFSSNGTDFYIRSAEVDRQLKDFSKLLNQARVVPVFVDGKHEGYKIKAIDKGSLYEKLGLKNNDIIQTVNGQAIDSPEKAFDMLNALRNEREVTLKLKRSGRPLQLNYHIN